VKSGEYKKGYPRRETGSRRQVTQWIAEESKIGNKGEDIVRHMRRKGESREHVRADDGTEGGTASKELSRSGPRSE
jgi:hypothetical protein